MITKMDKYTFVLFQPELETFIENIRELGMIDITRAKRPMDDASFKLLEDTRRYTALLKRAETFRIKNFSEAMELPALNVENTEALFELLEQSFAQYDSLLQERDSLQRERAEASPWGHFEKGDIKQMESMGLTLHFYSILDKAFKEEWNSLYTIQELNNEGSKLYFVVIAQQGEEIDLGIPESKFPQKSYVELDAQILQVEGSLDNLKARIIAIEGEKERLNNGLLLIHKELDSYFAKVSSKNEVENYISILSGFAPTENAGEIKSFLENEGCYFMTESAKTEDNPPIKLKNNWFSRLFEPIGEMYMMPTYGELDLTPFFAPFYMFFFGFCFGDMGYGLILLFGGALIKRKFKEYRSYINLVQFLGFGAIVMATVSGTFFGAKIYELFTLPDSIKGFFFNDLQMFWLAIIFGLVQIIFARLLRAVDSMIRYGWQHGLSSIGWALVVIWAAFSYAASMVPELKQGAIFNYLTGGLGTLLIIVFSETQGNIFGRLAKGTFALYDITGIFGDLLSYIRLFGLGTSGGILGLVVNSVAMNMLGIPYVGWFFTGLMLLIGHTAVLALSSLGAFVHPMRLTFVEFYKNMGFTGGGKTYNPLKKY